MQADLSTIEQELKDYERELYASSDNETELTLDAARKRAAYDVAYAQELLKINANKDLKLTVPEKEAMAVLAVQNDLVACRIAEAMAQSAKRRLDTIQTLVSSVQTRAKLFQTERSLTAYS